MEQILTIEEEKKYIAKYFHDVFRASERMDEFTGEKFTKVHLSNFVNFDKDFYDIEFKEVATKGALDTIRLFHGDSAVYHEEEYREQSCLKCDLLTTISSNKNKPEYRLIISFNNHSHNRELFNLRCYLLSVTGARYEIPTENLEKEHNSSYQIFSDIVSVVITEEAARMLTQKGTKISVRFDKLTINGVVDCFHDLESEFDDLATDTNFEKIKYHIKERDKKIGVSLENFIEMANVYNETISGQDYTSIFTDEQIDDLFEYCQQAETHHKKELKKVEQNKKKEKEDLQTAKLKKYADDTLEKAISINVNPYVFDTLELLFTKPMKIKEVKALKDYCEKNNIKSKNSEWLFSIDEKYDKDSIVEDVKRCRKKYETARSINRSLGFVLLAAACVLFGTCCGQVFGSNDLDDKAFLDISHGGWMIICFIGSIICGWWGLKKFIEPSILFNETTTKFIKDFEKRFPKK